MAETTEHQEPSPKRRRTNDTDKSNTAQDETISVPVDKLKAATTTPTAETLKPTAETLKPTVAPTAPSNKVYVGNLHLRVQQVHLEKLMQPYGTIVNIHMCYHMETGRPKGYAFCQFATAGQAAAAMAALHGRKLLGKSLVVQGANTESKASSTTTSSSKSKSSDSKKLADKIAKLRQALKDGVH